jgi:hypothetical protein
VSCCVQVMDDHSHEYGPPRQCAVTAEVLKDLEVGLVPDFYRWCDILTEQVRS